MGDPLVAAEQFRRLLDHWRRAGVWSTQWTTLRAIAALLARLGRAEAAAVLVGAILTTESGHRLFGDDALAIAALGEELRDHLGAGRYTPRCVSAPPSMATPPSSTRSGRCGRIRVTPA